MSLPRTASQTVGPFFGFALPWPDGPCAVPEGTPDAIWLRGRVLDGRGEPVPDALVETWQADADGLFDHPDDPRIGDRGGPAGRAPGTGFRGFGRCPTDERGAWSILTVKPGRVPGREGGLQAPHVDVSVFARGLLTRLVTRIYFADEPEANAADAVLALVPEDARATLIADAAPDGYRFDIRLQGDRETVFFDV